MSGSTWARSGRRPAAGRGPRPEGSFSAAVARAVDWWDALTGGRGFCGSCGVPCVKVDGRPYGAHRELADGRPCVDGAFVYADEAAAAILGTAVALWGDTAAGMAGD